jgi:hypothetical protein
MWLIFGTVGLAGGVVVAVQENIGMEYAIAGGLVLIISAALLSKTMWNCLAGKRQDPQRWTGHGFDASELTPRVAQVRRDYLAARRPAGGVGLHRSLLGLARRGVKQLGFFRQREPEEKAPDHGP